MTKATAADFSSITQQETHSDTESGEQFAAYLDARGIDDLEAFGDDTARNQPGNGGSENRLPDGRFAAQEQPLPARDIEDEGLTSTPLGPNPYQQRLLDEQLAGHAPGDGAAHPGEDLPRPEGQPQEQAPHQGAQEPQDGERPAAAPDTPAQPTMSQQLAAALASGAVPSPEQLHGAELEVHHQRRLLQEHLQAPELRQLKEDDPGAWSAAMVEAEMRSRQLTAAEQGIAQARDYSHAAGKLQELLQAVPEWNDPATAHEEANAVSDFLVERGYARHQLAQLSPAQILRARSEWVSAGRPQPQRPQSLWEDTRGGFASNPVTAAPMSPELRAVAEQAARQCQRGTPTPAPQLTEADIARQREATAASVLRAQANLPGGRRPHPGIPSQQPRRGAPVRPIWDYGEDIGPNPVQRAGRVPTLNGEPDLRPRTHEARMWQSLNGGSDRTFAGEMGGDASLWDAARRITDAGYAD